jgi:two-component system, OmpR family, alkaline phosphatase synthesis response regulator PhoP
MNQKDPLPGTPTPSADTPMPPIGSVLLVDDNLQNLELLQAYLEDLECPIRCASDGQEALDLIEADQPDIILLDIMMPRMSGYQICKKIRDNPLTRSIPVVMVTALNEVSDVERAVECGADDFLTKPVNRLELLTRVRSLLRVRFLQRELDRTVAEMKRMAREGPERGE